MQRDAARSRARVAEVDDLDRVVEAGQHVQPAARLVEHEAARAAAAHRDVVRAGARRVEGVVLELGGVEHADLARAERGDVERACRRSSTAMPSGVGEAVHRFASGRSRIARRAGCSRCAC